VFLQASLTWCGTCMFLRCRCCFYIYLRKSTSGSLKELDSSPSVYTSCIRCFVHHVSHERHGKRYTLRHTRLFHHLFAVLHNNEMAWCYSLGQIHRRLIKMLKLHIKFCKVPIQHSFFPTNYQHYCLHFKL